VENRNQFFGNSNSTEQHAEHRNIGAINNSTQMSTSILQQVPGTIYEYMDNICTTNNFAPFSMNNNIANADNGATLLYNESNKKSNCSSSSLSLENNQIYIQKRKKNNEAAKRSRDARIKREQDLALQAASLMNENSALKEKIKILEEKLQNFTFNILNT
jgi:hypothetical protein